MRQGAISINPIGVIHTGHKFAERTPIQPVYAQDCIGQVTVFEEYVEGLADLDGFSHVFLLYHFDRAAPQRLTVKPFLQDVERGIFATRAPCRPNGIGLSVVRLIRRDENILHIEGADMLDNTPLLDIKPFIGRFDCITDAMNGWLDDVDEEKAALLGRRAYNDSDKEDEGA